MELEPPKSNLNRTRNCSDTVLIPKNLDPKPSVQEQGSSLCTAGAKLTCAQLGTTRPGLMPSPSA